MQPLHAKPNVAQTPSALVTGLCLVLWFAPVSMDTIHQLTTGRTVSVSNMFAVAIIHRISSQNSSCQALTLAGSLLQRPSLAPLHVRPSQRCVTANRTRPWTPKRNSSSHSSKPAKRSLQTLTNAHMCFFYEDYAPAVTIPLTTKSALDNGSLSTCDAIPTADSQRLCCCSTTGCATSA